MTFDIERIETLLRAAAGRRRAMSYSELLEAMDMRFTRPRMRALCVVLDEVDKRAEAAGQPALASLVVRELDRLPGQGWWTSRHDYVGPWEGPVAGAYLRSVQRVAFDYWKTSEDPEPAL
ncbi:hypothetical protein GCM10011529_19540 [Polymorphobacter glacialis]|uniref:Ribose-phosphate pyrophosphokinase n=1 Tax=Sandarakinorhabdus glacialis TaxID=1614636 RepID=A0A916ZTK8_9SPHN|nr:ribose-phosphate pyrophosphokinase [Polymorphobacter glacialis]GGE13266.1 hypothetical protein GCM10011529_19540 [Polymorphobacter glacialis]